MDHEESNHQGEGAIDEGPERMPRDELSSSNDECDIDLQRADLVTLKGCFGESLVASLTAEEKIAAVEQVQAFRVMSGTDFDDIMWTIITQSIHSVILEARRFSVVHKLWNARQEEVNMGVLECSDISEIEDTLDIRCVRSGDHYLLQYVKVVLPQVETRMSEFVQDTVNGIVRSETMKYLRTAILNDDKFLCAIAGRLGLQAVDAVVEETPGQEKPEWLRSILDDEEFINLFAESYQAGVRGQNE